MSRGKKFTSEQIIKILREVEIHSGQGKLSFKKAHATVCALLQGQENSLLLLESRAKKLTDVNEPTEESVAQLTNMTNTMKDEICDLITFSEKAEQTNIFLKPLASLFTEELNKSFDGITNIQETLNNINPKLQP